MGRSHPFLLQRCGVSPLETAEVSPEASEVKWRPLEAPETIQKIWLVVWNIF